MHDIARQETLNSEIQKQCTMVSMKDYNTSSTKIKILKGLPDLRLAVSKIHDAQEIDKIDQIEHGTGNII